MTWQIAISLITLAFSILSAIALFSWRGGEWSGTERRHTEDLDRRMNQASDELSKLTGKIQAVMDLGTSIKVLETRFGALERDMERTDDRLTQVERRINRAN